MSERVYTSSVDRLAFMPEVFTGGELSVLFGWRSGIASSYLANWRHAGLIRSLGGRSDVHMNLVRNRQVNPEVALRRAYPYAVKVGVDILREAGWTTQIPAKPEVAVGSALSLYAVEAFDLTTRTDEWFKKLAPGIDLVAHGINRLKPAWALAEMIARAQDKRLRKAWLLDPEDIDLASARHDKESAKAMRAFGLDLACLDDSGYEHLYCEHRKSERPGLKIRAGAPRH